MTEATKATPEQRAAAVASTKARHPRGSARFFKCKTCGATYKRTPGQLRARPSNYCSRPCADKGKHRGQEMFCDYCDESFYRPLGDLKKSAAAKHSFCSRTCYDAWREEERRPGYKKIGGIHEHRAVAELMLGRKLLPGEVVHHIDIDKGNNSPENLAVLPSQSLHFQVHHGSAPADTIEIYRLTNLSKSHE